MPDTILIIEDEPEIAQVVTKLLTREGLHCVWHSSAADALAALADRSIEPALILLDGILPGMDGWEFMKALGADEMIPPQRLVLMSSLVDFEASGIPKKVKVVGKLDKPFTGAKLIETIKSALATDVGA
jgi:two-component system response regulator BaeR